MPIDPVRSSAAAAGRTHGGSPPPRRQDGPATPRIVSAVQAALAVGALLLAGASWLDLSALHRERDRVAGRLAEVPFADETRATLERAVAGAGSASEVRLAVAAAIVEGELAALAGPAGAAGDRAPPVRRLELAAELAAEAFALRPSSWQAPTLQGAAVYLARRLSADRRLFTESESWDGPLTLARRLAPGIDDPRRFAASAYIELWNALSPAKREEAVGLLRRAFADGRTFNRLVGAWLDIAEDTDEAMAAVPDRPHVWQGLQNELARRGDWSAVFTARERWRDALERDLARQLSEAERRARGGDLANAREIYLDVVGRSPVEERFVPLVRKALAASPPGPFEPRRSSALRPWLEAELRLDLVGRSHLGPELTDRLAGLVGDLPEPLAARAALAAGRLADAERIERRTPLARWDEDWQPYWVLKARALLARGHPAEAAQALGRIAEPWSGHPAYLATRREVAAAAGDRATAAATARRLAASGAGRVPAEAWRRARGTAHAELHGGRRVGSLHLDFPEAATAGAIEVLVDGRLLAARRVRSGRPLVVEVGAAPGLHLVELRTIAGPDPPAPTLTARLDDRRGGRAADDR